MLKKVKQKRRKSCKAALLLLILLLIIVLIAALNFSNNLAIIAKNQQTISQDLANVHQEIGDLKTSTQADIKLQEQRISNLESTYEKAVKQSQAVPDPVSDTSLQPEKEFKLDPLVPAAGVLTLLGGLAKAVLSPLGGLR